MAAGAEGEQGLLAAPRHRGFVEGSSPPPEASWRRNSGNKGEKKKKAKGRGRGAQGGELEAAPRGLEAPLRKSSELGLQESRQD